MAYKDKEKQKEYQRKWIAKKRLTIDLNKHYRDIKRNFLKDIKDKLSCMHCDESENICLDFHHRDPSSKVKSVSQMVVFKFSDEKILEEIDKCDVICANCHRKHHAGLL